MPLVDALARRHDRRGADHDDLVQAGSIGLLNAIERYDPKRGEEFVAFAVPTVAGEMKRHLRDRAATVRLPRRLHEARGRLSQVRTNLTGRLGRAPTADELAAEVGVSPQELAQLESRGPDAVDDPADEAGTSELEASVARVALSGAFQTLDDTDRKILYLRYVEERSRRDVASELGMSQGALARRADAALAKLRAELEGRAFADAPAAARVEAVPDPSSHDPAAASANSVAPASSGEAPAGSTETQAGEKLRAGYSGRLMLRMPQSLHAELAEAAEREEVSLNQFITNTLAAAMGWHTEGNELPGTPQPAAPPRWLPAALVTNIVVIVIAGLVALALLVISLTQGL
jgi:RNA polymerase sigma-B factor